MDRKTGQFAVMGAVLMLVVILVWNMYQMDLNLQTNVTGGGNPVGYAPNATGYNSGQIPSSKQPANQQLIGGVYIHTFVYGFKETVVLNALPLPVVTSNTDEVRWIPDTGNFTQVTLSDPNAVVTYFFAPETEGNLKFKVERKDNGQFVHIADFIYKIQSPLTQQADSNSDGIFDFTDLLYLIQNWNTLGNQATQMLAIVLSEYETN
ncbi:MAG: hypothetical protein P1V18_04785 [Candidatus Gracilibacteria bacterium]|nr:hypothetical protein [Candidatus Gracilibacteria bacterium]